MRRRRRRPDRVIAFPSHEDMKLEGQEDARMIRLARIGHPALGHTVDLFPAAVFEP
jgi:hypothetical protein